MVLTQDQFQTVKTDFPEEGTNLERNVDCQTFSD